LSKFSIWSFGWSSIVFLFLTSSIVTAEVELSSSAGATNCGQGLSASSLVAEPGGELPLIYIIDTNALYSDPEILERLKDHHVVIPRAVIKEMDRHKKDQDERAQTARYVSGKIRAAIRNSNKKDQGFNVSDGERLHISEVRKEFLLSIDLDPEVADDRIIGLAAQIQSLNPTRKVVVISGDNNLAILAKALGIAAEDPKIDMSLPEVIDVLSPSPTLEVSAKDYDRVADKKVLEIKDLHSLGLEESVVLHTNQFVVLQNEGRSSFWRVRPKASDAKVNELIAVNVAPLKSLSIQPRNEEQMMALDLLLDPNVSLTTISGIAGTGKTLLTLAAGLSQSTLFNPEGRFKKIVLIRPHELVGNDPGALPGDLKEKTLPLMKPVIDNLGILIEELRKSYAGKAPHKLENGLEPREKKSKAITLADLLDEKRSIKELVMQLLDSDFFQIEHVAYTRGATWHDALVIIDEAQNLSLHLTKTLITRAGRNTKFVLLGDVEQIDSKYLNFTNNGLVLTASRFRGQENASHITLIKGERSPLATQAAELLRP